MNSPVRWGVIGCGDVTEVKSGPGFNLATNSKLVAVMRRNGALAEDYARRHAVDRWFDNADALINDPDVDAVYIATPPGSHMKYALKVCAAGKPAYVEKPMARNFAECEQMVSAFEKADLPLFVAYYRRALDRFVNARRLISDGALGRITSVNYRFTSSSALQPMPEGVPWRVQAAEAGGGLFLDLGCHTLDIIDFLVGPLIRVNGSATNRSGAYAVEDGVVMRFETEDGALGAAQWNFAGSRPEDILRIEGTQGSLSISTFGNEPAELFSGGSKTQFDLPNPLHIQTPMIQLIVDSLLGKGECPSTGFTAQRTNKVMDIALENYYGGREDSFWTRPDTWPGSRR